jgi:uncharacterized membrane protein
VRSRRARIGGIVVELLSVFALLGAGTTSGVLLCVAISLVPGFLALPAGQYVEAHKLFGRYFDRVMPPIVVLSVVDVVTLALVSGPGSARALFGGAALALLTVSVISQTRNVPINRRVKRLDGRSVPSDWADPRRTWRAWHLLRTAASFVALVLLATAVVTG